MALRLKTATRTNMVNNISLTNAILEIYMALAWNFYQ